MFAALNINKPEGLTSHDVVARVRRICNLKKVGHGGTLDPFATGVLPVCLGQATRLLEYLPDDKRYRLTVQFGVSTDTLDNTGQETARQACPRLLKSQVGEAAKGFTGTLEQQIPKYSAKRINGKKLYELARQGVEIELPTKTVQIHQIHVADFQPGDFPVAIIDVHCGSGTFMRTLARDIGDKLGVPAHLTGLIRTAHGKFILDEAVDLQTLEANPQAHLQDPVPYVALPKIELRDKEERRLIANGMKLERPQYPDAEGQMRDKDLCLLMFEGQAVAVATWRDKRLKPLKVFPQTAETLPAE